jgi:hypothetical protein
MTKRAHTISRRTGRHAKELDGGEAFLHDPRWGSRPIADGDVEALGEEFVAGATSNEAIGELARDETYVAELVTFGLDDDAYGSVEFH